MSLLSELSLLDPNMRFWVSNSDLCLTAERKKSIKKSMIGSSSDLLLTT